jgi:hypothetical protein
MPVKTIASQKARSEMSHDVSGVYEQLCTDLVKAHKDYKSRERRAEKDKLIHGSLSEQKQSELDNAQRLFEKLFSAVSGLSEAMGKDMPTLEVLTLTLPYSCYL